MHSGLTGSLKTSQKLGILKILFAKIAKESFYQYVWRLCFRRLKTQSTRLRGRKRKLVLQFRSQLNASMEKQSTIVSIATEEVILILTQGLCVHLKNKYFCRDCIGSGLCEHGVSDCGATTSHHADLISRNGSSSVSRVEGRLCVLMGLRNANRRVWDWWDLIELEAKVWM